MIMSKIVCRKGASVVCGPNDEATHVWGVMERHGLSHIAVVDDNRKFLGMVSLDEVMAHCPSVRDGASKPAGIDASTPILGR